MEITEIDVGQTHYKLRKTIECRYDPHRRELTPKDLPKQFSVTGNGERQARRNLEFMIHESFQQLRRKLDFEMSSEENALFNKLSEYIDISRYREDSFTFERIGTIVHAKIGRPRKIRWEDGTKETIPLDRLPNAFLKYKSRQSVLVIYRCNNKPGGSEILYCLGEVSVAENEEESESDS